MLWYKAWHELRTRILVGVAALAACCALTVLNESGMRLRAEEPLTYAAYIWKAIYNSFGRDLFVILTMVLASGSLPQERAHGTVGFTLALPVSRWRLTVVRAAIGLLGVAAIAVVPAVVLPVCSHFVGEQYSVVQALQFSLLWACCGAVFYGTTFLLANLMSGEYSAMLVAVPTIMGYAALISVPPMNQWPMLDIFHVMNGEGMAYFDKAQRLLTGRLPWTALTVWMLVAAGFVVAAGRRIQQKDF